MPLNGSIGPPQEAPMASTVAPAATSRAIVFNKVSPSSRFCGVGTWAERKIVPARSVAATRNFVPPISNPMNATQEYRVCGWPNNGKAWPLG